VGFQTEVDAPIPKSTPRTIAVPGGLNRYNNLSLHTSIESNYLLSIVFEFTEFDLAVGGITVTNCLLTSMKINSAVYCHGCLLLAITDPQPKFNSSPVGRDALFQTSDGTRIKTGKRIGRRRT